jgi:alanine dehydrogenase
MRGGSCRAGGERRRGGRIGAVCGAASLCGERRELGRRRAELRDLEWDRGGEVQRLFQLEAAAVAAGARVAPRAAERREGVLPCRCVVPRERRRAVSNGERLGRDALRVFPLLGRPRDHGDETGRECHGQSGRRAPAGRFRAGGEPPEEVVEPQLQVVLGVQGRTSLRCCGQPAIPRSMPLYLTESDVAALLTPADAVAAVEDSFRRLAAGEVDNAPRRRLRLDGGTLADMVASDLGLGLAGGKLYAAVGGGVVYVVCLFSTTQPELLAVIEADMLGRLRTGAASGVAARFLARPGAETLGVLGCGAQAETQVSCVRAAVPTISRVVAYCRTPERLADFCERVGAEPAESHREAAEQDVVVTITSSRDPVVRGEWLRPGTLVAAAGANHPSRRELDNVVLERATFVCCDSLEQARLESGDLIEPVQAGVLDWLEVHELHEVVAGEVGGRQSDGDIVVFKSNGLAAWDVALGAEALRRAREQGVGTTV